MMYLFIRNLWREKPPKNGWGKYPMENDIGRADDIERIRHYSNCICHSDASGMDVRTFNVSCLDLFRVICIDVKVKCNIHFQSYLLYGYQLDILLVIE